MDLSPITPPRQLARRALLLALAAAFLAAPAAEAQRPPGDPLLAPPGRCRADDDVEAHHRLQRLAMHCLLRHVRRASGLRILRSSVQLRHSATYKARRIAACKVFTHHPCGDRLDAPFQEAQLTRRKRWLVGEDLAWDVGDDASPRRILRKWLRSPSHREVLLDRRFTHVGIRRRRLAMRNAPVGSVIWVAHVGRPIRR